MTTNHEAIPWPEERQKHLQEQLVGMWAEDTWIFTPTTAKNSMKVHFHFTLLSPSLKVEVKYAMWRKFDSGQ
jgi:hypothetical protein